MNNIFLLGLANFTLCINHRLFLNIFSLATELKAIRDRTLCNQKAKLLPYKFNPHYIPGKKHFTPSAIRCGATTPTGPKPPCRRQKCL